MAQEAAEEERTQEACSLPVFSAECAKSDSRGSLLVCVFRLRSFTEPDDDAVAEESERFRLAASETLRLAAEDGSLEASLRAVKEEREVQQRDGWSPVTHHRSHRPGANSK